MTREKWETMTPEERKAWRERMDKRDFIIYSIIVPVIVSIIVSPVTAKIVLSLLHK